MIALFFTQLYYINLSIQQQYVPQASRALYASKMSIEMWMSFQNVEHRQNICYHQFNKFLLKIQINSHTLIGRSFVFLIMEKYECSNDSLRESGTIFILYYI